MHSSGLSSRFVSSLRPRNVRFAVVFPLLSGVSLGAPAWAADAAISVSVLHTDVTYTRYYRDPATLPALVEDTAKIYAVVGIPEAMGQTSGTVDLGWMSLVQGGETVKLGGGVSMMSKPGEAAYLAPMVRDEAKKKIFGNTDPDAKFFFPDALIHVYKQMHKGTLASFADVMASDGEPLPVPEDLQPLGLTVKKLDEETFEVRFTAPGQVLQIEYQDPNGRKAYPSTKGGAWWKMSTDEVPAGEQWQDHVGDNSNVTVVTAGDAKASIAYTYLEDLIAQPLDMTIPLPQFNPDEFEPGTGGDIVSATRSCVIEAFHGTEVIADASRLTLTVALALPSASSVPVGWTNLKLKRAQLKSGGTLQLAEPAVSGAPLVGNMPSLEPSETSARRHGDEVLLGIPFTPVCAPDTLSKLSGTVDLLMADESSTLTVPLTDGKTSVTDPVHTAFDLKIGVRNNKDISIQFHGRPEHLDFQVVDKEGAPVVMRRTYRSAAIMGGSVDLNAEEELPEGAQLIVTAHRKVSRHTVSFAAKNVPLP